MRWYEFNNGPLRALKVLLDSPLDFDPVDYIDRTYGSSVNEVDENTVRMAHFYNDVRKGLFQKVGAVSFFLSNTSKIDFENYKHTDFPLSHEFSNDKRSNEKYFEALAVRTCDSVNAKIDRLLESFAIESCEGKSYKTELNEFISFYFLSEALFFVLVGMALVEFDNDRLIVKPESKERVRELHRKWFANFWEESSSMASIGYFDLIPQGSENEKVFSHVISILGQGLRDKVFSIPADELPKKLSHLESVQWISRICNLTALCMWCQLKNDMEEAPYYLIRKLGISDNDINQLLSVMKKRSQPDRVFSRTSKGLRIENPSITHQLRVILNDMANYLSENKLNHILGDFFEKKYVCQYFLKDELRGMYKVHSGFLPHEVKDDELKPDVDLILEDLRRKKFYFIQVKYLRIGGKAYISGDLDHLVSGKLSKGVKQLVDAKKAMRVEKISEVLEKKGLHDCNGNNSFFLLIHNISNFDFCVWPSGIVSYEWNSVRNLFKDGEINFGHSKSAPLRWNHKQPLPIERPDDVIDFLMNNGPAAHLGGASSLFEADHVVATTRFGNTELCCYGLGL